MKRSEVLLKNIPDIITTCIILHNLYIINNKGFEDERFGESSNKLDRRVSEGKIRNDNELQGERT